MRESHLRVRAHDADELSHYSSGTSDLEYLFPIGWSELEGIANRGNFDLRAHAEDSGKKLEWIGQDERYVPHVIEPAAGADRAALAFLVDATTRRSSPSEPRTVLRLHPRLAPVKVAVLPLVGNDAALVEKARGLYEELRRVMPAEYDDSAAIGKRYRRQDEIGTPWALTIDHDTLEDGTITFRDRDSLAAGADPARRREGDPARAAAAALAPARVRRAAGALVLLPLLVAAPLAIRPAAAARIPDLAAARAPAPMATLRAIVLSAGR